MFPKFEQLGDFLSQSFITYGTSPTRVFVVKFQYTKGEAFFDGKSWDWKLYEQS